MTAEKSADSLLDDLVAALGLPASCRVDQRVPKKMLLDHGAPTAADKRLLNERIDAVQWLAALKPHTIGVPAWQGDAREYLEIAVLTVTLRPAPTASTASTAPASVARLTELLHRAVPYPLLLLMDTPQGLTVSAAHKRWAHNEAGKVVLDGGVLAAALQGTAPSVHTDFLHAMALHRQPQTQLMALYEGWMACLLALQVAQHTGQFLCQNGLQPLCIRRDQLQKYEQLQTEATRLRSQAGKARQMAQQVQLNLELKRLQCELEKAKESL